MSSIKEIEVKVRVKYSYTEPTIPLSEELQNNIALHLALGNANYTSIEDGVGLEEIEIEKEDGTILKVNSSGSSIEITL